MKDLIDNLTKSIQINSLSNIVKHIEVTKNYIVNYDGDDYNQFLKEVMESDLIFILEKVKASSLLFMSACDIVNGIVNGIIEDDSK